MRQKLIDAYLDYTNNYLTVGRYAEAYGMSPNQALMMIELGRQLHETPHPDS
jgi:hypothetical protein